ncbi:MAG: SIMPL domain-containing protein [Candidatus Weimeria sp.]
MGQLRVTGRGQIKVKPDVTRLIMEIDGTFMDYEESMKHAESDTETLKAVLAEFGFEKSDIKTLSFDIDSSYENYYDKNNHYQNKFIGYKYSHTLKVEFDNDNSRLGKILYALTHSSVDPEISIRYTVKDPESAKNQLLGKAVEDAKNKAGVLASAAGVRIKEIESIDYSWGEINIESMVRPEYMLRDECSKIMPKGKSFDMDIEPDDIDMTDTVTVVWGISD